MKDELSIRVQKTMLECLNKEGRKAVETDGKFVYFTPNGFILYRFPKAHLVIDLDKCREEFSQLEHKLSRIFEQCEKDLEYVPVTVMREGNMLSSPRYVTLHPFEVCVDKKFIKPFLKKIYSFEIKDKRSPVKLYEKGELICLIMPLNFDKKKE